MNHFRMWATCFHGNVLHIIMMQKRSMLVIKWGPEQFVCKAKIKNAQPYKQNSPCETAPIRRKVAYYSFRKVVTQQLSTADPADHINTMNCRNVALLCDCQSLKWLFFCLLETSNYAVPQPRAQKKHNKKVATLITAPSIKNTPQSSGWNNLVYNFVLFSRASFESLFPPLFRPVGFALFGDCFKIGLCR